MLSPTNVAPATRSTGSMSSLMYRRYVGEHRSRVAEAERRTSTTHVVIAGNDDDLAHRSAWRMNARARWNSPERARCDRSPEMATTSYRRS